MSSHDVVSSIIVDKKRRVGTISRRLYGGLMELMGEVFTGGLNAEMIRNRKFANVTDIEGKGTPMNWESIQTQIKGELIEYITSYSSGPLPRWSCCFYVSSDKPQERGICQGDLAIEANRPYILTFLLRYVGEALSKLTVSLADEQGEQEYEPIFIGEPNAKGWRKYTYRLVLPRNTDAAELRLKTESVRPIIIAAVSMMPEDNIEGFRADMVEELKSMGLKLLRFPGGCAAEGYDWRMGIGPKDDRPAWLNLAWKNIDSMDTGTDEICRLAEILGGEVHMTVNISTLTEEDAAQWVEYCNGSADSKWGSVRAANGHPEPYNVKLWGLGNEADQMGFPCDHTPEEYTELCNRFMVAMRKVDQSIEFVIVGSEPPNGNYPNWEKVLSANINEPYEYHSAHLYTGSPTPKELDALSATPDDLAMTFSAASEHLALKLEEAHELLKTSCREGFPLPKLYLEEWGFLSDKDWETDPETLSEAFNLRRALFLAGTLNALHRKCDKVSACNVVFPTGIDFVFRSGNQVIPLPAATAMGLHQKYAGTVSYFPEVECPTYTNKALGSIPAQKDVPFLDVAVSADEDRKILTIMVVNRHPDRSLKTSISIRGFVVGNLASVYQIAHVKGFGDISDWYDKPAYDSVGKRGRKTVPGLWCTPKLRKVPYTQVEAQEQIALSEEFSYEFLPHSFTVIVCDLVCVDSCCCHLIQDAHVERRVHPPVIPSSVYVLTI